MRSSAKIQMCMKAWILSLTWLTRPFQPIRQKIIKWTEQSARSSAQWVRDKVWMRIWWRHTEACRSAPPHTSNHFFFQSKNSASQSLLCLECWLASAKPAISLAQKYGDFWYRWYTHPAGFDFSMSRLYREVEAWASALKNNNTDRTAHTLSTVMRYHCVDSWAWTLTGCTKRCVRIVHFWTHLS